MLTTHTNDLPFRPRTQISCVYRSGRETTQQKKNKNELGWWHSTPLTTGPTFSMKPQDCLSYLDLFAFQFPIPCRHGILAPAALPASGGGCCPHPALIKGRSSSIPLLAINAMETRATWSNGNTPVSSGSSLMTFRAQDRTAADCCPILPDSGRTIIRCLTIIVQYKFASPERQAYVCFYPFSSSNTSVTSKSLYFSNSRSFFPFLAGPVSLASSPTAACQAPIVPFFTHHTPLSIVYLEI